MKNKWTTVNVEDNVEGNLAVYADGEVRRDVDLYLTEKQYDELIQGYRCCRCMGLVDTAFPETCGLPGCDGYPEGFPMRERQRAVMQTEMTDEVRTPSKQSNIWTPN